MENVDHILVFKTNIKTLQDKLAVKTMLDNEKEIDKWNIDLHDVDCVLRVISYTLRHQHIINLITVSGYDCCELI